MNSLGIIIPVYQSKNVLVSVVSEIIEILSNSSELEKLNFKLNKIYLVDDGSIDGSHETITELSSNNLIFPIYLNRNYGQHAAIFAGVLSSTEEVLVTMDEDGEHNPLVIIEMIKILLNDQVDIVYAKFISRNLDYKELSSKYAKKFISKISRDSNIKHISSFRAVNGSVFRTAAVYANNGSFLDVALSWISNRISTVETTKRNTHRKSTYSFKGLVNHFSKLFFAAGIKPLIFLFNLGWVVSLGSLIAILIIIYRKVFSSIPVQGWVSNIIVIVFFGGIMISSIGLVARYLSSIVETSSGKPFFTIKNQK